MTRSGDYGGLGALIDQAAVEREAELSAPPTACPLCGEPLDRNHAGDLACPRDGWRWDGITVT